MQPQNKNKKNILSYALCFNSLYTDLKPLWQNISYINHLHFDLKLTKFKQITHLSQLEFFKPIPNITKFLQARNTNSK